MQPTVIAMANQDQPTPFGELKALFEDKEKYNDLQVLRHCIGHNRIRPERSDNSDINQARSVADQLAEHIVLVCIDTEHWTMNSDEMTEIGVAVMDSRDVRSFTEAKDFGDHGENLMRQAKFHFFRLREKAHLHTTNAASKGPAGNRFGEVRFVSFAQARTYLRQLMNKPIENVKALRGYNRPVIVLGHSIGHDRDHLNGKDLDLSVSRIDTIIRYIDTQVITNEAGHWWNSRDPIGLHTLVKKLGFEHADSHTAANDVGRTLMSAILLALPKEARTGCSRGINQVASDLESYTRNTFHGMGGTREYCCNCGSIEHMHKKCDKLGRLSCNECVSRGLMFSSTNHITKHCPIVRDEVAAERLAWYAGQGEWAPKYPFSSRNRLQTYDEFPTPPLPATNEEITARRKWYDGQRNSAELKPFVWYGRSFEQSPLANVGPPPGQRLPFSVYSSSHNPSGTVIRGGRGSWSSNSPRGGIGGDSRGGFSSSFNNTSFRGGARARGDTFRGRAGRGRGDGTQ
jgi:hypothetical protein